MERITSNASLDWPIILEKKFYVYDSVTAEGYWWTVTGGYYPWSVIVRSRQGTNGHWPVVTLNATNGEGDNVFLGRAMVDNRRWTSEDGLKLKGGDALPAGRWRLYLETRNMAGDNVLWISSIHTGGAQH